MYFTDFRYFRNLIFVNTSIFYIANICSANVTSVLLSISWGLECRGREQASRILPIPNFPMAQTNSLVLWSLVSGKKSRILNLFINSKYFLYPMTVWVIESALQIYFGVLVLSLTGKIMLTSLIDYFSKQLFPIMVAGIFISRKSNW